MQALSENCKALKATNLENQLKLEKYTNKLQNLGNFVGSSQNNQESLAVTDEQNSSENSNFMLLGKLSHKKRSKDKNEPIELVSTKTHTESDIERFNNRFKEQKQKNLDIIDETSDKISRNDQPTCSSYVPYNDTSSSQQFLQ